MLDIQIVEETVSVLPEYGKIPISFEVNSIFEVQALEGGLRGFSMSECPVDNPWVKDYDENKSEGPTRWGKLWDISNWVVISGFIDKIRVGGCVIAYDTPGVYKLENRKDIAFLWDLRVLPNLRGEGIGGQLLGTVLSWARRHRCKLLKVETQNINVPACRFYAKHGFTLGAVNRYAYPKFPDEVELIWCLEL